MNDELSLNFYIITSVYMTKHKLFNYKLLISLFN